MKQIVFQSIHRNGISRGKRFVFSFCVLLAFSGTIEVQAQTDIFNFINPRLLSRDLWNASYEYRPADGLWSYGVSNSLYMNSMHLHYKGFKLGPFVRYNISGIDRSVNTDPETQARKPKGKGNLYIQVKGIGGLFSSYVRYYRYRDPVDREVTWEDKYKTYAVFGTSFGMGYQVIFSEKFDLDLFLNLQFIRQAVPRQITLYKYEYEYNSIGGLFRLNPWYSWGPGSILEFRAALGFVHKRSQ